MAISHENFMRIALNLAQRGLGNVAPNPAVGCLVVDNCGVIVGRGWTQPGGRPHAETVALDQAGKRARGATAFVTLEPCAHTGKTPPCATALIEAGISKVVCAIKDTDPRVSGQGFAMLRAAGIEVVAGVLEKEARRLNLGFFLTQEAKRPLYSVKSATSLDGRIATAEGKSKWITGPEARAYGHLLRAQHDAIMVGIETVLADDPSLDCRLAGLNERSPAPIIMDGSLRTPLSSQLVKSAAARGLIIVHAAEVSDAAHAKALAEAGVKLIAVPNTLDLSDVSKELVKQDITRILVEGGGQLIGSFLRAGFCDRMYHFTAPKVLGADGKPAIGPLGLAEVAEAPHLTLKHIRRLGADSLATYEKPE